MDDNEERVILVDENDRELGTADKLASHRQGALHRAFSVIVWDGAARTLLQKRAARKYHSGGLWANACCGHPRPGEDNCAAAERRLREEMGFACALEGLGTIRYRAELDHGMIEHELVHVYRGLHDGTIAPDPSEVDGYQWVGLDELRGDVATEPARFSAWLLEYLSAKWPFADATRR